MKLSSTGNKSWHLILNNLKWLCAPGACFTIDFPSLSKIAGNFFLHNSIHGIHNPIYISQTQLSWHVQYFVAIELRKCVGAWSRISIEFELRWKNYLWNGYMSRKKAVVDIQYCGLCVYNRKIYVRGVFYQRVLKPPLSYIYIELCDVITNPCSNLNGALAKSALKLGRGWVITPHKTGMMNYLLFSVHFDHWKGFAHYFRLLHQ